MDKISCIAQARMNSTRLPGKVMMFVDDETPIIEHVVKQLKQSKLCNQIVIATTTQNEDEKIVDFARKNKIPYFRGSIEDCLDRYYQCAKTFSSSIIVRITCDNPLIDPTLIDEAIMIFKSGDYDYVTNCKPRTFPQGTEVEVFSFNALKKAWNEAKKPSEREHVTPYFYNNPDKFRIFNITNQENISNLRWTVDRKEDLEFVRIVVSKIKKSPILMTDILQLLKKEQYLKDINKNFIMDEGYLKSLENDKKT
ncbi:MAG: glycosyltransferase family protein [Nitrosarchaeum sp.]|nr:glycosyltransferase family protein [Nitrosarchaeum sp.]